MVRWLSDVEGEATGCWGAGPRHGGALRPSRRGEEAVSGAIHSKAAVTRTEELTAVALLAARRQGGMNEMNERGLLL
jgi:hypothetical protein